MPTHFLLGCLIPQVKRGGFPVDGDEGTAVLERLDVALDFTTAAKPEEFIQLFTLVLQSLCGSSFC